MKKYFYLLAFILISAHRLDACHIVGAEIYYDCVGPNTYLVTLIEYRNCGSNNPMCADYGDPEYIQIFDTAGNYIDSFYAPFPPRDTITNIDSGSCSMNSYCIEKAVFQTTVTLPYLPGGYVLVFQRCCRNNAIQDIAQNSGATYFTYIPDSTMVSGCDSKPRFRQINPQPFSVDTPFTFDMSATDPDGDLLVYRLTNSSDGASGTCPDPSPAFGGGGCPSAASPPPYVSVAYLAPYTPDNPTNNPLDSGHLRIDPHTGILSGRVNQSGIFLVAVAADEYRNGVLIGSTLLDFQFIFGGCPIDTSTTPTAVNDIRKQSTRIYSVGNEAIVDGLNGPATISFYDLLGQQIAQTNGYTGTAFSRRFENIPTQYLIAKVQLANGQVINKKLLIENDR